MRLNLMPFATAAFLGYATCDPRIDLSSEAYLSAFTYPQAFRTHLEETGSTKDYLGPCGGPWVWFDVDHPDDPQRGLRDARGLAAVILERYRTLDEDSLLYFYSGFKGYHVGLPTFWHPVPSVDFHRTARQYAEGIAALARATVDAGVYDKVRAFRAPNSRHPKTGLHKRRLSFGELMHLSPERIRELAASPEPFDLPPAPPPCEQAAKDWADAAELVRKEGEAKAQRRAVGSEATLNRLTLDFIRDGADQGDRHRLLFSAAANLAELGCPPALAHALLTEAALDCGLSPGDVRRQIDCGLNHQRTK